MFSNDLFQGFNPPLGDFWPLIITVEGLRGGFLRQGKTLDDRTQVFVELFFHFQNLNVLNN